MSRPFPILPPTYYRDHFLEMIRFVMSVYGDMLGQAERAFIESFLRLSETAQCLFIRMSNRKKGAFAASDLGYSEIEDVAGGLAELKICGFTRSVDVGDYRTCLEGLAKGDIFDIAIRNSLDVRRGWTKPALITHIHSHLSFDAFTTDFDLSGYVVPAHKEAVGFLLYLYFGKLDDNLTRFALRDLGVVSTRPRDSHQARFDSLDEARAGFVYTQLLKRLRSGEADVTSVADGVDNLPRADSDFIIRLRDQVLFALGQAFEKAKDSQRAIAVYQRSTAFDSHERLVRLLMARGDKERVRALLQQMMDAPAHDEEYIFATDFFARKFGDVRTGVYTALLREAETIEVDELYRGHAEQAAIAHFVREGWQAHHTENGLWPALFGLVFWDELFETPGSLCSDFDLMPKTLKDRSFHRVFASEIARKLARVEAGESLAMVCETTFNHAGDSNGIVWWRDDLGPLMAQLLGSAPPSAVRGVLEHMSKDFYALRDGFPDLMLTQEGRIRFVEIKAEGDQLRRNQLARLNLLKNLGFEAEICKVKYRVDPDQTYVVVDVETTGGRPPNDRVTEIGAVKVRCGQVVEEWHSLINPQKHIPSMITQLTGISDAMVRDAPVFADIADDFAAFMEGAIFVAHNVNFDHGFIASEYRRLNRSFRHPKLCTVASMRKHYPGHASYGLANLCRDHHIRLDNHHRALNDARAAADLLHLVNARRLAPAGEGDTPS